MLNQEEAQRICDKWTDIIRIGSWKFNMELCDSIPNALNESAQFRYNCQTGVATLQIVYEEVSEKRIVAMLVDFSLIHMLLPTLKEGGDQYLDHDDRNIQSVIEALLRLEQENKT